VYFSINTREPRQPTYLSNLFPQQPRLIGSESSLAEREASGSLFEWGEDNFASI